MVRLSCPTCGQFAEYSINGTVYCKKCASHIMHLRSLVLSDEKKSEIAKLVAESESLDAKIQISIICPVCNGGPGEEEEDDYYCKECKSTGRLINWIPISVVIEQIKKQVGV